MIYCSLLEEEWKLYFLSQNHIMQRKKLPITENAQRVMDHVVRSVWTGFLHRGFRMENSRASFNY
jgi:hypothetical protein